MRFANGYGGIVNLGSGRRNRFGVRITKGFDDNGKQIRTYIGYYRTRSEANKALAEYNSNPYNLNSINMTFEELYKEWCLREGYKLTLKNYKAYANAFKKCGSIHSLKVRDIKKVHLQDIIDEREEGFASLSKLKMLYSKLFTYALENDIILKDYSQFVTLPPAKPTRTKEFNFDYYKYVLSQTDEKWDTPKVLLLTGLRVSELLALEKDKVFEKYMIGGLKTEAGIDRCIPIMDAIKPIIQKWKKNSHTKYLHPCGSVSTLRVRFWNPVISDYTPHDCRHTFISVADRSGINQISLRAICGHKQEGVAAKIYTHKTERDLIEAMSQLENFIFNVYLKQE